MSYALLHPSHPTLREANFCLKAENLPRQILNHQIKAQAHLHKTSQTSYIHKQSLTFRPTEIENANRNDMNLQPLKQRRASQPSQTNRTDSFVDTKP